MFFNELEINQAIEKSQYGSNYSKILCSGFWNGLGGRLVHIFEQIIWDIGKRLKELHSLGISHNDVRIQNIHVLYSGRFHITNDDGRMRRDLEELDFICGINEH
ncbi:uncharacterized protein RJT20DRAFT_151487 [Scheffersomyces xylosifermentans]|uniref:uncharacterized protein n=1 Tax=Scheffersomyces xylosifermentans TaxID=1304137 RepID=UPI00315D4CE5